MAKLMSKGTTLEFSTDSWTTTLVLTCQTASFDGPASTTEVSENESLCDEPVEKTPGSVSYSDFSVTGYFDPADEAILEMQALAASSDNADWRIIWTDAAATNTEFVGFVNGFGVSASSGEAVALSLAVAVSSVEWVVTP